MTIDHEFATHLGEADPDADYPSHEARIIQANKGMLPKKDRAGQRAQHPKAHATVEATFEVLDLAEEDADLRVGLFAKKSAKPLKALVRFSNSRFYVDNPDKGDAHGMAVKVFGVKGEKFQADPMAEDTFDFILMNNETFFDGNLAQYADFNDLAEEHVDLARNEAKPFLGRINRIAIISWLKLFDPKLDARIKATSDQFPESPVKEKYFSTTPYLLGPDTAVKYRMEPDAANTVPTGRKSPVYLHLRLREALERADQVFTLYVEVRDKEKEHPVEDPTVPWTGARSVAVAKLTIPQVKDMDNLKWAQLRHGREPLSYNIWNVTEDHRPLGAINRVRRKTYSTLHKTRTTLDHDVYG